MEHPAGDYDKDKLAADYFTVPVMLNFNFTPKRKKRIWHQRRGKCRLPVQRQE